MFNIGRFLVQSILVIGSTSLIRGCMFYFHEDPIDPRLLDEQDV